MCRKLCWNSDTEALSHQYRRAISWTRGIVRYSGKECFYVDLLADESGQARVLLKNGDGSEGTAIRYNQKQLPCFALWKNLVDKADGYVTGLEPATNFPNCHSIESRAGRVVSLNPGEAWSANMTVDWLNNAEDVNNCEAAITKISSG